MNRIEIIEKLTSTIDQMDDKTLVAMSSIADFLMSSNGVSDLMAETSEKIRHNEREAASRAYELRLQKIQDATGLERQVLNLIELAKNKIRLDPDSDLGVQETDFLIDLSVGGPLLVYDAYRLGYARGSAASK